MAEARRKVDRLPHMLAISMTVGELTVGFSSQVDGHVVRHRGLLHQARAAMVHGTPAEDDSRRSSGKPIHSPMPMPEHIFMTIMEAEAEIAILATVYGAPVRSEPSATLRALVGHLAVLDDDAVVDLDKELSWVARRLRVALSWEPADRRLRQTNCPSCTVKDTVWVKLDEYGPASAYCSSCHATWLPHELADLLDGMGETT